MTPKTQETLTGIAVVVGVALAWGAVLALSLTLVLG